MTTEATFQPLYYDTVPNAPQSLTTSETNVDKNTVTHMKEVDIIHAFLPKILHLSCKSKDVIQAFSILWLQ